MRQQWSTTLRAQDVAKPRAIGTHISSLTTVFPNGAQTIRRTFLSVLVVALWEGVPPLAAWPIMSQRQK